MAFWSRAWGRSRRSGGDGTVRREVDAMNDASANDLCRRQALPNPFANGHLLGGPSGLLATCPMRSWRGELRLPTRFLSRGLVQCARELWPLGRRLASGEAARPTAAAGL